MARDAFMDRFEMDLIGPGDTVEALDEAPSKHYLTGILYPQGTVFSEEEDEALPETNASGDPGDDGGSEATPLISGFKPSACGFSFSVSAGPQAKHAHIELTVSYGRYERVTEQAEEQQNSSSANAPQPEEDNEAGLTQQTLSYWKRRPISLQPIRVELDEGYEPIILGDGLRLIRRVRIRNGVNVVTLQFVNDHHEDPSGPEALFVDGFDAKEGATFFQFTASVVCKDGCSFVPRPKPRKGVDRDERIADLIYREAADYAVGHTASVVWSPKQEPTKIDLTWMPTATVQRMNPEGDKLLSQAISKTRIRGLYPKRIANESTEDVLELLNALSRGYSNWIDARRVDISNLDLDLQATAEENLRDCVTALVRIEQGIGLLKTSPLAMKAFRLANSAMFIQAAWSSGPDFSNAHRADVEFTYSWRPFQLAYALMCLASCADRAHIDREIFDLIWFPTGGGKTEAYLLIAAFVMIHRRLSNDESGAGVAVLMRYTLRTLTVQQFSRAAALITAMEAIRLGDKQTELGKTPFSIGLWVGGSTTPNRRAEASEILSRGAQGSTPAQIRECTVCRTSLHWEKSEISGHVSPRCPNLDCALKPDLETLPIFTVDDDIYDTRPSLVIGTIDKFAQIVRRRETGCLFGADGKNSPPDLIIQDELHLIGGPLGSLTGLYESAIDELCRTVDGPVKIVGSTATIRRAGDQIRNLFDRSATQFPPPGLDWRNNGFAVLDETDPGRLYVGLSTTGRSEKYTLQAASASLLQSAEAHRDDDDIDPYFTLVAYFNSLKVLGGALVLMEDDVRASMEAFARRRGEEKREIDTPQELTSRKPSSEIPRILEDLSRIHTDPLSVDVLLATNMLSVGVDIPRLGLMLVNGQPKFMSEYIQATSRVGRSKPGLVVTLYNNNKIRDRAHFEAFCAWHTALYRSVEPSSVTPFASRARDKAIHAPLMALVLHLVESSTHRVDAAARGRVEAQIEKIVMRIKRIDPDEADAARRELYDFTDRWFEAASDGRLKQHWNDRFVKSSLLVSAETAAALRALGRRDVAGTPTPNSMRNVEPSVKYLIKERPDA